MPTVMTHAVAGVAIAQVVVPARLRRSLSWIAAGCAMLPDADVIGFRFGVPYGDVLGHRGITHSLAFAVLLAVAIAAASRERVAAGVCVLLATASHGVLDAFTDGGLGVAFFAPFDTGRYFFPWTPIPVSPLGAGFFTARGADVFVHELLWVWCPSITVMLAARLLRRA